MEVSFC